jgi:hypothetical protein
VDGSAWSCDSCHTNNYAADTECRVCGHTPGSATGAVQLVSHEAPPRRPAEQVTFVQSKHAAQQQRSTIFLTPPTPPTPTPPKPAPLAPRPASRAKKPGWLTFVAFAVVAVAVIIVGILASPAPPSAPPSANSPSASHPCPDNVAEYLPNSGSGAVLIGQYTDDYNHIVTICVIPSTGQYYYDGQVRGQPVNNSTHISLPASQTGSGYVAMNGVYTYQITGTGLIVSKNGTPIRESKLTQIAP